MTKQSKRRLPWVLMALGALMALAALGMLSRTPNALQYCAVAPQAGEKGENYAKLAADAVKLGEGMKDALAWTAAGGTSASVNVNAGDRSAQAALFAIGEGWLEVYPRFIEQGRRPGESELASGAKVAMLDANLAFQMFGEDLPEDAAVQINGVKFSVVGTVRHAGSLFGSRGVGDGQLYDVYVPLLATGTAELPLETFTLSALPVGSGGGASQLGLIVGLYAMVGLFKRMTALATGWIQGFRAALKQSYIKALIPRLLGLIGLILLGYGALIALTWGLMVFSAQPLYVFTEWVPENIVDWSSISKVFWSLTGAASALVRVGTRELRVVEFWGGLARWGIVLFLLGAALRGKKKSADP